MVLCQRCEAKSDAHGRNLTFAHLKQTTCEFCRLVYEGIIAVLSPIVPHDSASATFPPFSLGNRDHFDVHIFTHAIIISFWCSWGTKCPWGILPTHRDITPLDYDGEGSFNTALEWIRNCTTHHGCSDNAPSPLPTRVIDVGLDEPSICLVSGNSKHSRYMCLSHCWGLERPLMTTTKNLSAYLECIPWSDVPATFRDAILLARRLEIQYIWIDSLCIIQDSQLDWERESSKMADIYRNSYLTIAASASRDSTGGLDPGHARQPAVSLNGKTLSNKAYSIRCQYAMANQTSAGRETPKAAIQHPISSTKALEDYGEAMPVFPLLTRGWVFQERLLSPRFLQFGRDELLWDCRETMLCECGQRPPDLPYNQVSIGSGIDHLLAHKWRKIIEFYCSLNLTYVTDKLPALSGLARHMGERRPGATYLAGLWSDSLDLDLLWVPYGPERSQGKEYLGPSWSWSCSYRRIIYPGVWRSHEEQPSVKVMETYFTVLEASCTVGTEDPNGRVAGGRLKMKVPLFPLTVDQPPDGDGTITIRYKSIPFSQADGIGFGTKTRPSNWRNPFEQYRRRVFFDNTAAYGAIGNKKIYGCRVTRLEILENSNYFLVLEAREVIHIEFSLLLEKIDEGDNVFRRIGLLADGRVIDGHLGDAESWLKEPSCFDVEVDRAVVTII